MQKQAENTTRGGRTPDDKAAETKGRKDDKKLSRQQNSLQRLLKKEVRSKMDVEVIFTSTDGDQFYPGDGHL